MSAFIVSDSCMNNVVSAIKAQAQCFGGSFEGLAIHGTNMTAIGRPLYAMNNASIMARYGQKETLENYEFEDTKPNAMQSFASISCLLYQCNEGNIDETPLYKALESLGYHVACDIMEKIPAYKATQWD